jgi:predicted membrane protein (TIGR00267 family)
VSLSGQSRNGAGLQSRLATLRHYHEIADVGEIARRYFPMNGFDGVLTSLGIVTGAYFGGVNDVASVIVVLASASLSLGVSGFYGTYLSEQAERARELRELEETMLSKLATTDIGSAARYATLATASIAGVASALGGLVMCIPFILHPVFGVRGAFYAAWCVAVLELVFLGVYLGRVSRGRVIVSSVKFLLAGAVAFGLSLLLNVAGL